AWMKELQFVRHTLSDLGMVSSQRTMPRRSSQRIEISSTGSWSAKEYLPMGAIYNKETDHSLFFQIEHNGSWKYEIGEAGDHLYLALSGPDELTGHWWKRLGPGETFVSVPVGVGAVSGFTDEIGAALTLYRRAIRRKHADNRDLPVIFNDYMNCLDGDPTTEKEKPLIDKAAEAGCEYYVIDAGWYADGYWWDNVGEWQPSAARFPDGLPELIDYIRQKGMIPGLWLEIEVMGVNCPKASKAGDDWFFTRHGKRVAYRSRWQLDFRSPGVRAHADEVIDRLVGEYGVGYIKMDYNIEPGAGTDLASDSFGDGLLMHNRAYLAWLESVMDRYPDLVIENCSSGGMRMDYAMLSRHSIQSTSDITDYRLYSTIAANAPMALTPEQAAVWSYPLYAGDVEEAAFNMVNAMLLRIHQSGPIASLKGEREELVLEGIRFYREIRSGIPEALPFWPLGLSGWGDPWACLGLRTKDRDYLAVWRRDASDDTVILPVKHRKGMAMRAVCAYPKGRQAKVRWNMAAGTLSVQLPREYTARIIELKSFGVGR
ncbi:MAG: alpha-galactosidase, partial [Lachnospiraceae bacterium]|nr:alpha-galactosidase [Lachnospiraceae bacterium]